MIDEAMWVLLIAAAGVLFAVTVRLAGPPRRSDDDR